MQREPERTAGDRPEIPSPAEYAGAGLQFAIAILLFLFAGQWLDGRFGTTPWLVIGAFVGAAAGFYLLYRKLNRN